MIEIGALTKVDRILYIEEISSRATSRMRAVKRYIICRQKVRTEKYSTKRESQYVD
jgi:hypothetical protein